MADKIAPIVVVGEALIDFLPEREGRFRALAAGSPLNVAIGLGRLGVPVAFRWVLSTDPFGDLFEPHLVASGVDVSAIERVGRPSTLAFVTMRDGEPAYAFYDEGSAGRMFDPGAGFALGPDTPLLHIGSYVLAVEPVGGAIERFAAARPQQTLLSLDVNIRERLVGDREAYVARLRRLFSIADIVKASEADLAWLEPGADPAAWAQARLADGALLAAVTLGGAGALAVTASDGVRVPAPEVAFVDAVGAGDSFMAGLLASLHRQGVLVRERLAALDAEQTAAALTDAVCAGAIACSRAGADPPWLKELDDFVRKLGA